MQEAKRRLDRMVDGVLDISGLNLISLDWMLEHPKFNEILFVNCSHNQLTSLPKWPLIKEVHCSNNRLEILPCWSMVKEVFCDNNQLTSLPEWPMIKVVYCDNNQLTSLPKWSLVNVVSCDNNQLTWLPLWPSLITVGCNDNLLPYTEHEYLIRLPKLKELLSYLRRKAVIAKWRKFTRQSVAKKKHNLHNELKYSPDLPFVWHSPEVRHWLERVIETGWLKRYNY